MTYKLQAEKAEAALLAAAPPTPQEPKYFEVSHHELSRYYNENFLWDCFKRFEELVPCPRGILGDNLVMMWRRDFEKL